MPDKNDRVPMKLSREEVTAPVENAAPVIYDYLYGLDVGEEFADIYSILEETPYAETSVRTTIRNLANDGHVEVAQRGRRKFYAAIRDNPPFGSEHHDGEEPEDDEDA